MKKNKCDVGILVFTNQATLDHKLLDGREEDGDYVFWYGGRMPKRIMELLPDYANFDRGSYPTEKLLDNTDIYEDAIILNDYDVRIYFQVEGKIRGYFKVRAIKEEGKGFEIRFFSNDWIKQVRKGKKGHQGWEYYLR